MEKSNKEQENENLCDKCQLPFSETDEIRHFSNLKLHRKCFKQMKKEATKQWKGF